MKNIIGVAIAAIVVFNGLHKVYTATDDDGSVATVRYISVTPDGKLRGAVEIREPGKPVQRVQFTDDDLYQCTVTNKNNWTCNGFLAQKFVMTEGELSTVGGMDGKTHLFDFKSSWEFKL